MSDDTKVLLAGFVVVMIILAGVLGLGYWLASKNCHSAWERSGFAVEFALFSGCQIQRKDGTWIPARNYREVQD